MAEVLAINFESGLIDAHGHTLTSGGLTLQTSSPIAGTTSAKFTTSGYLKVHGITIGTQDFGLSFLARVDVAPDPQSYNLLGPWPTGLALAWFADWGSVSVGFSNHRSLAVDFSWPIGQIVHVEIDRQGTIAYLFLNGDLVGSFDFSGNSAALNLTSSSILIGNGVEGTEYHAFPGLIDNVKLNLGAPFHTANFTPDYGAGIAPETGFAALPIHVLVGAIGNVSLPIEISSVPAAFLGGAQSVAVGVGANGAVPTIIVRINGIDVSEQVTSDITIDAEEGAARIAEFTLRPPSGTVLTAVDLTGRPVEIDVADNSTGTPRYALRRFTGIIDTPTIDQTTRSIALRCTDDLQGRCHGMSNAELMALIGGKWSPAVTDSSAIGWTYAQDLLSTVKASLDISPLGELRLTPWAAKTTPDLVLDQDVLGENSLVPKIADRSSLVNHITVSFDYRFPRLKAECYALDYDDVTRMDFSQQRLEERAFMQRTQIVAAIESAGGTVESITYIPLPNEVIEYGIGGYWTPGPNDGLLCMGFRAQVSFDYAQTTDEQYEITVYNPRSIEAVGLRRTTMSGALVGEYPDIVATETGITLFKNSITSIPPSDRATAVLGYTTSVDATLSDETNRDAANNAIDTLVAIAKTRIAASHRTNQVSATVPFIPFIDLDKTLRLEGDGIVAQGKCTRTFDRLSMKDGYAVTDLSIALSAIAGYGIVHDEDETPDATTETDITPLGTPTVVFNGDFGADLSITITFPGVEDTERNNAIVALPSVVRAPIEEDLFTITL